MVIEHSLFEAPETEEIKVWRYMDFTKFISLIDTRRLFFARADSFEDPFEGSYPRKNVEARKYELENIPDESKLHYIEAMNNAPDINKQWPRYAAISCWHMNEHESAAMWSLYLKSNEGIAVQSTFKKLKKALIDDEHMFLGVVKYIDYKKDQIQGGNILGPFVHKRKSFEHERELRGLIMRWPGENGDTIDFNEETIFGGITVKVDIEELIEKIYVAPNAPSWFANLVKTAVKKYGYDLEVIQSEMNNAPMF